MALATQADVEARLQITFTNNPEPVVTALLADAQAHIEGYVGRSLESASHTETHDPTWPVRLHQWPVTTVTSVTVDGTALVVADDIVTYPRGRIYRTANGRPRSWGTSKLRSVDVVYTAGYLAGTHDRELAHLGSIVADMVARAFRLAVDWGATPEGAGAVQSVALEGSDTVTYATGGGDIGSIPAEAPGRFLALLDSERRELDSYKGLVVV